MLEVARPYEPLRIERVLTPEDPAREIQYAGGARAVSLGADASI